MTILKDKDRRSRGVAFLQYHKPEDAETCTKAVNNTEVGRIQNKQKTTPFEITFFFFYFFRCSAEL